MRLHSSFTSPTSVFCWLVIGWLLLGYFRIARARRALRAIEKTHIVDAEENFHEDIELRTAPRELRRLVERETPALHAAGFVPLLTGRRMRLVHGRANTYYHQYVSPDGWSVLEFQHVRVARMFRIWPAPLPLSQYIGPSRCSYTFESMLLDQTTLITTTSTDVAALDISDVKVNLVHLNDSFAAQWQSHQTALEALRNDRQCDPMPLSDREAVFEKERIQRRQIAVRQQRRMKELREKSCADVWDNKPEP